ncbi:unnamed protein product [Protopolystoma xenopodis]|uniref:Uncharacterized protein n=1 Tax=Protopolystoma xenopodis TaxID=117903 RepID=A0A3S5CMA9_9PLAT|nr:unnamed protein product [Protopolystoma xenopodis]
MTPCRIKGPSSTFSIDAILNQATKLPNLDRICPTGRCLPDGDGSIGHDATPSDLSRPGPLRAGFDDGLMPKAMSFDYASRPLSKKTTNCTISMSHFYSFSSNASSSASSSSSLSPLARPMSEASLNLASPRALQQAETFCPTEIGVMDNLASQPSDGCSENLFLGEPSTQLLARSQRSGF